MGLAVRAFPGGGDLRFLAALQPPVDYIVVSQGGWHGAFYILCGPAVFYADIMRAKKKREDLLESNVVLEAKSE